MNACKPAPANKVDPSKPARQTRTPVRPAMPDKRLWKADKALAFEAGIKWFLAVSRAA